jgi:hypothetical protein
LLPIVAHTGGARNFNSSSASKILSERIWPAAESGAELIAELCGKLGDGVRKAA